MVDEALHEVRHPAPAVAVCVPLYRKEQFVGETIQSVLDQTFTDFELVVLDNASPDGSADVVKSFHDPRIVLEHNPETVPAGVNFNKVVALSRAPLVKVLAADDLIHRTCLERQVEELTAHERTVMVTCRHNVIDETGRVIGQDRLLRTPDLVGVQDRTTVIRRMVRHGGNPVGNPCNVLFRRSAFEAAGGFGDDEFFTLDVSMWSRLLEHGDYLGLPETLASFRINSGSYSSTVGGDAIGIQRAFVNDLRRSNPGTIRWRDSLFAAVRAPLTQLRHHVLFAAAAPTSSPRRQAALRIMAMGSQHSARR